MTDHCIKPACGTACSECNDAISTEQREVLLHALMGGQRRRVYRNYFVSTMNGEDWLALERCVAQGLMRCGRDVGTGGLEMAVFHCTEKGARAVRKRLPKPLTGSKTPNVFSGARLGG